MQALFYTTEFRNAIYSHADGVDSVIVKSLAKLFATLELTSRKAVSTKELTEAFGWGDSQRSYQSDIHELQTILFDSLSLPDVITELYEFEVKDQLEFVCMNPECKFNNCRGQKQTMTELMLSCTPGNFAKSLKDFEGLETLDGDNKIECDKCKTRSDAKKYQCVSTLPKILNICLRRLEFDMVTLTRKRVHDSFEIPFTVELSEGLSSATASESCKKITYHLNSAIVHSGTANGGHYYSYNRYPLNSRTHWVKCNDSVTTIFTNEEFKDVLKHAGSTVYMMVFTQDMETSPIVPVPPSIAALVEKDEKAWKEEKICFDIKRKLVNVVIVDQSRRTIEGFPKMLMETQKVGPLVDYIAKTNYPEESLVDKFRLRRDSHNMEGETFNGREDDLLVDLYTPDYGRDGRTLRFMIDSTPKDKEWEDRKKDDIKITCVVSEGEPSEREMMYLRNKNAHLEPGDDQHGLKLLPDMFIGANSKVGELKIELGKKLNADPEKEIFVFLENMGVPISLNGGWDDGKLLKDALPGCSYVRTYGERLAAYLCVYVSKKGVKDEAWKETYNIAMNSFVYSYNKRSTWSSTFDASKLGRPADYKSFVKLDQNKSFRDLMEEVRKKEGLERTEEFHLIHASDKGKGEQIGINMKEFPDIKISDVWGGKGGMFHVVLGKGLSKSECWVQFVNRSGFELYRTTANTSINKEGTTVGSLKDELVQHVEAKDKGFVRFQCGRNCAVYMKDSNRVCEFANQRKLDCGVLKIVVTVLEEREVVGVKDHAVNVKVMDVEKKKVIGGGVIVVRPGDSEEVEDIVKVLQGKYGNRVKGDVEISKFIPNRVKLSYANLLDPSSTYGVFTRGPGDVWSNGLLDWDKKSVLRGKPHPTFSKVIQADAKQMSVVIRGVEDFKDCEEVDGRVEVEGGSSSVGGTLPCPPASACPPASPEVMNGEGVSTLAISSKYNNDENKSPWRGQTILNRRKERAIFIKKERKVEEIGRTSEKTGPETQ